MQILCQLELKSRSQLKEFNKEFAAFYHLQTPNNKYINLRNFLVPY